MKILTVEPNPLLNKEICAFLEKEGCLVDSCGTYVQASDKLALYDYDCIILNTLLPDGSFLSLLNKLLEDNKTDGVIVISSANSMEERVMALNAGADDFMSSPLHFPELSARINAIIRRKKFNTKSKVYVGNLVIDLHLKTVHAWSTLINLTKKEYEILLYLIANKDKIVSKVTLTEYLWGDNADNIDSFNMLFAHIKNLKKKINATQAEVEIKNIYGVGYQIIEL
jgi:DNA-binding response OmpR family regulator